MSDNSAHQYAAADWIQDHLDNVVDIPVIKRSDLELAFEAGVMWQRKEAINEYARLPITIKDADLDVKAPFPPLFYSTVTSSHATHNDRHDFFAANSMRPSPAANPIVAHKTRYILPKDLSASPGVMFTCECCSKQDYVWEVSDIAAFVNPKWCAKCIAEERLFQGPSPAADPPATPTQEDFTPQPCSCDMAVLMHKGCQCAGC